MLSLLPKAPQESKENDRSAGSKTVNKMEDVLIKMIRVIANLSINEEIGPDIASNDQCVMILIKILGNGTWHC